MYERRPIPKQKESRKSAHVSLTSWYTQDLGPGLLRTIKNLQLRYEILRVLVGIFIKYGNKEDVSKDWWCYRREGKFDTHRATTCEVVGDEEDRSR